MLLCIPTYRCILLYMFRMYIYISYVWELLKIWSLVYPLMLGI